jgi:hypothetical protein
VRIRYEENQWLNGKPVLENIHLIRQFGLPNPADSRICCSKFFWNWEQRRTMPAAFLRLKRREKPSNVRITLPDIITFDGFFDSESDILKPRWLPTAVGRLALVGLAVEFALNALLGFALAALRGPAVVIVDALADGGEAFKPLLLLLALRVGLGLPVEGYARGFLAALLGALPLGPALRLARGFMPLLCGVLLPARALRRGGLALGLLLRRGRFLPSPRGYGERCPAAGVWVFNHRQALRWLNM